ncbi:MAG TPA: sodium:proton antiporter [Oceanospirillales bacterium]|nr:sodium:proton antiporter [Oceanospirillales bacterium]
MTKYSALLFISGLVFMLMVITGQMPLGQAPMLVGNAILEGAKDQVGAANVVTSVVLAYRGLDTLGELSILFAAATVVGLVLNKSQLNKAVADNTHKDDDHDSGFVAINAIDLIFPLLIVVGMYIITHGHLTPGGGFQGGVVLAVAFSMLIIVRPRRKSIGHGLITFVESFAGFSFILIGLLALFQGQSFLQPLLGHGEFASLWSAGTLPILYLAVGLKVGAELAGVLLALNTDEVAG